MKIQTYNGTIHVTGVRRLDESAAEPLHKAIIAAMPEKPDSVDIDLTETNTVDSIGLRNLVDIQETLQTRNPNAALNLIDPAPPVRQLLELTRLDQVLHVTERNPRAAEVLPLFVFIDACGWEIIRNKPFLRELAPNRRPLRSVFGYSSACIPSILSGRWPAETRNWCYFVKDPANSPFRALRALRWIPKFISGRRIFRRRLSQLLRGPLKFRGYFDLYNIPFKHISLFDFTEKKNPIQPGGLNAGPNIFDFLTERNISYHVSDPRQSEHDNLHALLNDISAEQIDFGFLYWPGLDGVMHEVGNNSPLIDEKLQQYEEWMGQLIATAKKHYKEIRLYVFSDHGMANCDKLLDLRSQIDSLPLQMPRDYTVVYDSTMARFWFSTDKARERIVDCLRNVNEGRILEDAELKELGTFFPDRYFGELIFLAKEGVLIIPSDMGERPLRGMHGYHPDDPQSFATFFTNVDGVDEKITDIPHIYRLMVDDAQLAHAKNNSSRLADSVQGEERTD